MFSGCKQRRIHLLLKISVVESNFGSYFSLTGCKQVGKGQAAEMLKVFMSKVIISSVFILFNEVNLIFFKIYVCELTM